MGTLKPREEIFSPRLHKFSSIYRLFSCAYYTSSIIHISVDNWMNKKIVLPFAQYFPKCITCKIKLSCSEFNPENAGLNKIKEVFMLVLCSFPKWSFACATYDTNLCSLGAHLVGFVLCGQCNSS